MARGCWLRRSPRLRRPLLTTGSQSTKSTGTTSSSNRATSQRTGRLKRLSPAPQRMKRRPCSPQIHSGIRVCNTVVVGWPGSRTWAKTKSPLGVGRTSRASAGTPQRPAKPRAAAVGEPSTKAVAAGGPLRSSRRSSCRVARPPIRTARRLGVPVTRSSCQVNRAAARSSSTRWRSWGKANLTKSAGSSSLPISSKNVAIVSSRLAPTVWNDINWHGQLQRRGHRRCWFASFN